jgi:hypothetical protein
MRGGLGVGAACVAAVCAGVGEDVWVPAIFIPYMAVLEKARWAL